MGQIDLMNPTYRQKDTNNMVSIQYEEIYSPSSKYSQTDSSEMEFILYKLGYVQAEFQNF